MVDLIFVVLIAVATFIIGGLCGYFVFLKVLKGKYNTMVDSANK